MTKLKHVKLAAFTIAMTKKGKGIALLLDQKSKRHRPPNLESQTPNKITFSKIEKAPLSESQKLDSQQDCFLKNRRGTALRISRARLPTGLRAQKSKRHRPPNLKSQTPNMITLSKIEETLLSESREPDSQHDYFLKNRRDTAPRISRARPPTWLLSQKSKRHRSPNQSKRRSLSQKLGCSETTRADLRNRRGTYFSSLGSTCHTHTQLCRNYGHSVEDFWWSRKHMNLTVQSPTSHTQH